MGYAPILRGHVEAISHGITVDNAQPGSGGLATVNPVFTWVRLAQRLPVCIHIDEVPPGVTLATGLTATVQIDGVSAGSSKGGVGHGEAKPAR